MEPGYQFNFAFPEITIPASRIHQIEVFINGQKAGDLQLLESMGKVANYTFQANRDIIIVKTLIRTVVKGLAAAEAKKELKRQTKANDLFGALMDVGIDIAMDATENADLRCWRTMPNMCYVGEFRVDPGKYDVEIRFLGSGGVVLGKKIVPGFTVQNGLNLIDAVSIN